MHKPLILIIDTDPDTRSMYAEYFRYQGYRAAEAEDGMDACQLFPYPELQPSVVVTELSEAPEWMEAIARLRRPGPGRETPLIACSTLIDPSWPFPPAWLDADVALPKPATPAVLFQEAQQLLARQDAISRARAERFWLAAS